MTGENSDRVPFEAHVELLRAFLTHRTGIAGRIEAVLNAQRRPPQFLQDRPLLARMIEDCFFTPAVVDAEQTQLRGQLEHAHWTSGFRPRQVAGLHNDLIHPAEMMIRGFYCWQQTRWPGRNGRLRYAETLFNVYMLRSLVLLSMRLWDAGPTQADERLAQVQSLLDALWQSSPADQPTLVRDARWLIPLAQSPTTDELAAYFVVAENVAESLAEEDRLEIQKAGVRMIGGHLTSQIRHYCMKERAAFDDPSIVLRTRTSNALDFALLVQGLVPLLEAYEQAIRAGKLGRRPELAAAILQGVSPDPEVFLQRVELLGPYSMIEHLFVTTGDDAPVRYSAMGQRHVRLLERYTALIGRLRQPLHEDCPQFRPAEGSYSPYGAIFGTPSNLTEHMALKALERDAPTSSSLEDVFEDGDADRLAWVDGWRRLPHIAPDVQRLHAYPHQFAAEIFGRIENVLGACVAARERSEAEGRPGDDTRAASAPTEQSGAAHAAQGDTAAGHTGRLYIVPADGSAPGMALSHIAALPRRYIGSSDPQVVAAGVAEPYDETRLLRDRQEGYFLVSYATSGGWVAISKDCLTEILGTGQDAKVVELPARTAEVLRLTCVGLVAANSKAENPQASVPPSILNA